MTQSEKEEPIEKVAQESGSGVESTESGSNYPTFVDLAAMYGVFVLTQFVGIMVARLIIPRFGLSLDEKEMMGWVMMIAQAISMLLLIIFILFLRRSRRAKPVSISVGIGGFNPSVLLGGFVMMLSAAVVIEPLLALLPSPPDIEASGWPLLVSVVFLAPLFEELICRGLIFGALRRKRGVVVAWLVSSLFFGLMHLQPSMIINGFVMGLILCYIYIRSRSIFAPIILHALNNGVAYLLILLGFGGDMLLRDVIENRTIYFIVYGVALILLVASTLHSMRQFKRIAMSNRPTEEEYEEIFASEEQPPK